MYCSVPPHSGKIFISKPAWYTRLSFEYMRLRKIDWCLDTLGFCSSIPIPHSVGPAISISIYEIYCLADICLTCDHRVRLLYRVSVICEWYLTVSRYWHSPTYSGGVSLPGLDPPCITQITCMCVCAVHGAYVQEEQKCAATRSTHVFRHATIWWAACEGDTTRHNGRSCLPADFDWLRNIVWSGFVIPLCWCLKLASRSGGSKSWLEI